MKCGPCALEGTVSTAVGLVGVTFGSVAEVGLCGTHAQQYWEWFMEAFTKVAMIDGEEP
ncbi:hypothetical protein GCM10020221_14980 [Streptomyces thioluteus]|uniref:Uncharacterized protein n=1 Tax=Streptomyces thioluteus TaxID=66431 RepID=A0ABP6J3H6_STRTU